MTEAALKALRQIHTIAANSIAECDIDEDATPPEIKKALPRGAGKEYVKPLLDAFHFNDPFIVKDVLAKFRDRYPNYRISEQTITRALNNFADDGLLARVGTGWKVKSKLKSIGGAA